MRVARRLARVVGEPNRNPLLEHELGNADGAIDTVPSAGSSKRSNAVSTSKRDNAGMRTTCIVRVWSSVCLCPYIALGISFSATLVFVGYLSDIS